MIMAVCGTRAQYFNLVHCSSFSRPRLKCCGDCAFYSATMAIWNALSPSLCQVQSLCQFKRELGAHLIQLYILFCIRVIPIYGARLFLRTSPPIQTHMAISPCTCFMFFMFFYAQHPELLLVEDWALYQFAFYC